MDYGKARQRYSHIYHCAAFSNGCASYMSWKSYDKNPDVQFLTLNGWWLSYDKWVCPRHPKPDTGIKEARNIPVTMHFDKTFVVGRANVFSDGRVDIQLSGHEKATALFEIIEGGILKDISIGFSYHPAVRKEDGRGYGSFDRRDSSGGSVRQEGTREEGSSS